MNQWHQKFLGLAKHISTWSKDSTKVGAVIVDPETNTIIGVGYNGFPRGVIDDSFRLNDRDIKYKLTVHAEVNAILNSNKSVRGCDLYVYPTMMIPPCCPDCAKAVVNAGIRNVYGYANENLTDRWQDLSDWSTLLFNEGGVRFSCEEVEPK
ncbi:MAG: deaminase [Legionella sp.]|uniref:deoxycytidylate deaminase n=1 Tax=Legionella sp. TaxID=459 RepID=UPI00284C9241|nr:deaminase [Legionella sp.]